MPNNSPNKNLNNNLNKGAANSTLLVKCNEILVKKEEDSVVVRNAQGKLVRRKSASGNLDGLVLLIKPNETLVKVEENAVVVRNAQGKLVKRKAAVAKKQEKTKKPSSVVTEKTKDGEHSLSGATLGAINPALKVVRAQKENSAPEEKEEKQEPQGSLRDRLKSRHAFLERLDRGESVRAAAPQQPAETSATFSPSSEYIEDVEEIEDSGPDASVTALEEAVTSEKYDRTMGKSSSKAQRGLGGNNISGSAVNPNKKQNVGADSHASLSLAGNNLLANLPTPEKIAEPKDKKVKKPRKPFNATAFVISLVAIYAVGILAYFFIGYNFKPKEVDIVLYYISIGKDAKLNYYDGEKINTTDMLMTFYYSENDIKTANLTESNIAEPTVGMGYNINNMGYVNALWTGSFANKDKRVVKLKFDYNGLICYVPVTVYRNKLNKLVKHFVIPSLEAGQEINPTIYAEYTNEVIEKGGEVKQRELMHSEYDLVLNYNGHKYSLKELGCYVNGRYVLPETIDEEIVDYSLGGTKIFAKYASDGFNTEKTLLIY